MRIYFSSGSKGGVGKSFVCMGLLDYLTQSRNKKIVLIESDTSNPDVSKAYGKDENVKRIPVRLDDADGWIELVNICDQHKGEDVIVNSAARSNEAIAEYGETLTGSLEELQRDLVTFWVINRQRDSMELLKKYEEQMPRGSIHVVRNTFFGEPKKFELYNTSKLADTMTKRGKTLDFPDIADRVADDLYSRRLSIANAMHEMPIGNRAELKRWRGMVWAMFGQVIGDE